jgi:hypothetical protein
MILVQIYLKYLRYSSVKLSGCDLGLGVSGETDGHVILNLHVV